MSAKVKGNRLAFETFSNEITSSKFKKRIKKAILNPEGADQKYVINKILPVLEFEEGKSGGGCC